MAETSLPLEKVREQIRALLLAARFRELAQGTRTTRCRSTFAQSCGEEGFDICARFDEGIVEIEHVRSCWCLEENPSPEIEAARERWLEMYFHLLQNNGYRCLIVHLPGQRSVLRVHASSSKTSSLAQRQINALIPQDFS